MRKSLVIGTVTLGLLAGAANAAVVSINSAGALAPNDSIDWGQLGVDFTPVASPAGVTSGLGLNSVVIDGADGMERRDQGSGWFGNFAPGAELLWNQGGGTLTINFAAPVQGVGAQIQRDIYGLFTADILVNGGALGTFGFNGDSNGNSDNSAIFIGVLSDAFDITSITFQVDGNGPSFAIGELFLGSGDISVVPEMSTWAMMIGGFGLVGGALRRRTRVQARFA